MTAVISPDSLKYIAVTLGQMADMLRDFELLEAAGLLEKAKADIEHELVRTSDKPNTR